MGFESAYAARRRLALVAESNEFVQQAVQDGLADAGRSPTITVTAENRVRTRDVTEHLDQLARDIMSTPGAGGALMAAFAAQARALTLVVEAARRTQGAAALPAEVMAAVQSALRTPSPPGLEVA